MGNAKTLEYFITTARGEINSARGKFDITNQDDHRSLLILCTDAVEAALKAVLMKRMGWTEKMAKNIISHKLADIFDHLSAPSTIIAQVNRFDNEDWSWVKRYASDCHAAQTTRKFPGDPFPAAEEIVAWAEAEFDK